MFTPPPNPKLLNHAQIYIQLMLININTGVKVYSKTGKFEQNRTMTENMYKLQEKTRYQVWMDVRSERIYEKLHTQSPRHSSTRTWNRSIYNVVQNPRRLSGAL